MVLLSKLTRSFFMILSMTLMLNAQNIDCDKELLSISIDSQVTTKDVLQNIANYCSKSLVIKDALAKKKLEEELFGINIIDLSLNDILDLLLKDKDLYYSHEKNIIKISGLETKTFRIDYVNSTRGVDSKTDINLGANDTSDIGTSAQMDSGSKILSTENFNFWKEMQEQITGIINTSEDIFVSQNPIINPESGLITITATKKQLQRVEEYIHTMMKRLHKQVLIDVNIMYVTLSDSQTTGIDWSQFFSKSLNLKFEYESTDIQSTFTNTLSGNFTLTNVINFLKTIGDVTSISNPKVLTLNNQPAIISSGEELFYKTTGSINSNTDTGTTTVTEAVKSIFAGVLLDITPAITDENELILKINPSISALKNPNDSITVEDRTIPPDLLRKQLSSVVKLKDGEKVILGGLIEKTKGLSSTKVPILGSIPIFGIPFRYDEKVDETKELVIIITPHIIRNDVVEVTLKNLGFDGTVDSNKTKENKRF